MSTTTAEGQYLAIPALEMFEQFRDGRPRAVVRAARCGPDRLHPSTFDDCPFPLEWVLYWYRAHTWCADGMCRCRRIPRFGDGLCIAAFSDGRYGYYSLTPTYDGKNAIRWAEVLSGGDCLTREDLARLEGISPIPEGGPDEAPCQDAVLAVWRTIRAGSAGSSDELGRTLAGASWDVPEWVGNLPLSAAPR